MFIKFYRKPCYLILMALIFFLYSGVAVSTAAPEPGSTVTPVGSLDIGMLGFYSDRYVIGLGGLIDPAILPHLEQTRVGPYMVEKGATHYFHMIRHDSDIITGVSKWESTSSPAEPWRSIQSPRSGLRARAIRSASQSSPHRTHMPRT